MYFDTKISREKYIILLTGTTIYLISSVAFFLQIGTYIVNETFVAKLRWSLFLKVKKVISQNSLSSTMYDMCQKHYPLKLATFESISRFW